MVVCKTARRQLDTPTKNRIIRVYKVTGNAAKAANIENVNPRTTQRVIKRYEETGSTSNKPRTSRPRILSDHDERAITCYAQKHWKHRQEPLKDLAFNSPANPSASTVPYLTRKHKKARIAWARKHRHYRRREWSKVIWSNECYIYLGDRDGRVYVTRREDEVLLKECTVPTFKQPSVRVMVWGCIMDGEKGPLVVLEYPGGRGGGMNSKRYQEQVLEGVLRQYYAEMKKRKRMHKIKTFPHPSSLPDVSPIEPVWHELKSDIHKLYPQLSNVEQLIAPVRQVWDNLSIERISKYTSTMQERVEAVIEAKGGHTNY
ncbi:hypothetical protein NMY22_g5533 [Coprinellus aureogranulatus]|nr:hypothetical protein NMY22_g5533 [Coprinellus aureogranulatus]